MNGRPATTERAFLNKIYNEFELETTVCSGLQALLLGCSDTLRLLGGHRTWGDVFLEALALLLEHGSVIY